MATPRKRLGYSVRKLPSGRFQLRVRDPATRDHISVGIYEIEADADRAGLQIALDQYHKVWSDPRGAEIPLSDYLARWIDECHRSGRHGDLYHREVLRLARLYVNPTLGHVHLSELRRQMIRRWFEALTEEKGPRSLVPAKAYRMLHAALEDAVRDEVIQANPAMVRAAGVERSPERPLVEPEDVATLAGAMPPYARLLVLLAAWCGLRLGELDRLQRKDIDLLHRTITVRVAKTPAGERTVSIPSPLISLVEQHLASFSQPGPEGRVFVGPRGGRPSSSRFGQVYRDARSTVGLDHVHLHDLRHHAGTMATMAGGTEREVMRFLGHSSPGAFRRYQHAADRRQAELAEKLGQLYEQSMARPWHGEVVELPET